jgi:hypothetical protein
MQYYVLIADLYVHILLTYRQIPRLRASYFRDAYGITLATNL